MFLYSVFSFQTMRICSPIMKLSHLMRFLVLVLYASNEESDESAQMQVSQEPSLLKHSMYQAKIK